MLPLIPNGGSQGERHLPPIGSLQASLKQNAQIPPMTCGFWLAVRAGTLINTGPPALARAVRRPSVSYMEKQNE